MPPHTSLYYTMPPNTTNSKSTATTANSGTTQMNTSNKSSSTPSKTSRQRRAVSSSYVFAPSWLNLNNNKSGTPTTVLSSAYVSTTEEKSVKEEVKGVGASKKEGLGGIRQSKEGLVKDGSSSLNRSATPLLSTRSKSRDLSSSRSSAFGETENHESSVKLHGRSRSVSQVNQPTSSTSSSFDKNFKQLNLSVDLPAKNVENIWANLEAKSKLLSPTSTPNAEENIKFSIPNIDNEPELERRMSLVPKVESGKLDGKRPKHSIKRKTSRSLSVDSVARGTNGSSVFGFGVGIGIPNGRSLGQTQNARSYLRENTAKPISSQPQRQRAASISASNGIKKISVTTPRMGSFGQSTITGRKSSIGGNSKYLWSDKKASVKVNQNNYHTDESPSSSPTSSSLEREEKFLLELGWKKPYNKDTDSKEWAITE
ncbi:6386_t:CDS:2 [Rhizophagus irregularis]|nr:6386_t:CDS:2 [Rhizophagus irregularis]